MFYEYLDHVGEKIRNRIKLFEIRNKKKIKSRNDNMIVQKKRRFAPECQYSHFLTGVLLQDEPYAHGAYGQSPGISTKQSVSFNPMNSASLS